MPHRIDRSILREYDIRGVVGETLGAGDARAIGAAFGQRLRRDGGSTVVVSYDGRLSSPMLEAALVAGLAEAGCDVVRLGLGPTPMMYFAETVADDVHGGIQVTGSHNPPDHNGFKLQLRGRPFFGAEIRALGELAASDPPLPSRQGAVTRRDVGRAYVDRLLHGLDGLDPAALAAQRIGWDCGNGAVGPALERLTARLPGEHHLLYTEVDGHFPHHHPDPADPRNLADLRALVAEKHLDFGVAFDGDGDRIGVIDGEGRVIAGDQLLAIYAEDLLLRRPGATVIADIKCSRAVLDRIAALGGKPLLWKSGHSLVKARMRETGALLAGEMTGHAFFADDWYGFDDALYAAIRLIAATLRLGRSVTRLHRALPRLIATPELRFPIAEARKFAVIAEVAARLSASGAEVNTIDGVRVNTPHGWWLLRASNTESGLAARAESSSQAGLARLLAEVNAQLAALGVAALVPG